MATCLGETQQGHRCRNREPPGHKYCRHHRHQDPGSKVAACLGETQRGHRCRKHMPAGHKYCHQQYSGSEMVDDAQCLGQGIKRRHSVVPLRTDGKRRCYPLSPAQLRRQLEELQLQIDHQRGPFSAFLARSRMKYLEQLLGFDATATTCQQKINVDVQMMSGELLTNINTLSPSLPMCDLQQQLEAEFPELGDIELVVGTHRVRGTETMAELITEHQLMEAAAPHMTVNVIRRPRPLLHVKKCRPEDFGIKEDIVFAGLDAASTLGRGIAKALQVHLDKQVWPRDLSVAIVISNPLKDAASMMKFGMRGRDDCEVDRENEICEAVTETCLQALGIVEGYRGKAETERWNIEDHYHGDDFGIPWAVDDFGIPYQGDEDLDTLASIFEPMIETLSGHFHFEFRSHNVSEGTICRIWGGFDAEGSIVGILTKE